MKTNRMAAIKNGINRHVLEIILVLTIVGVSFITPDFLKTGNVLNILRNASMTGIIAFGMTFVIIAGEIDLSIGSTVGFSGVVTAMTAGTLSKAGVLSMDTAVIIGMLLALVLSVGFGLFNGFLLTKFKMPSFIITLGMLSLIYGLSAVISKGFPVTSLPSWFPWFGAGMLFNTIPVPAVFLLVVFLISFVVMNYTKFGRAVYATGGNEESARLSGINTKFVKIAVMVVVQVCAAFSGILLSSQVMSGSFSFGKGWEMVSISAVIIGGASLSGGTGKVTGTFIGLIFLGVINNAMTINGVDEYVKYIVQGALILIAVLINSIQRRRVAE